MEFQKIINLLDTTSDNKDLPRFFTKKWIEVYDQSEKITILTKKIELKRECLDQIYAILVRRILL